MFYCKNKYIKYSICQANTGLQNKFATILHVLIPPTNNKQTYVCSYTRCILHLSPIVAGSPVVHLFIQCVLQAHFLRGCIFQPLIVFSHFFDVHGLFQDLVSRWSCLPRNASLACRRRRCGVFRAGCPYCPPSWWSSSPHSPGPG